MEGKVKIPFFQRTYVWDEDNWEDLIEEFLDEEKTNNFLGAIILKQLPPVSGKPKELEVIDGQQRLTTISILLRALYDSFPEDIKQNVRDTIFQILFFKKDYTSPDYDEIRIEHSLVDSESYRKVIKEPETINLDQINEKSHRILRCYKFFREIFENMSVEEKRKLLNKILDPDNKMLVVIDLEERDDEQSIFDTLNTAGVRLTSAEIVKNALFKRLIELSGKQEAIKTYKETWEKFFMRDEDTLTYWEKELTTGRLKRQNIEILLHSVAVIEGFYDPDKHTLSDLSKLYKKKIEEFRTPEELKNFITKIIKYAEIYKDNIYDFDKSELFSFSNELEGIKKRLLHILNILDISTFHPFILYIIKSKDETEQKEYLKSLENFVICNAVARKIPIKNYNKLVKQFIKDPTNLKKEVKKITKEDIETGLKRVPNKLASLILFWIELYRRHKEKRSDILELKYTYSLEHIMPVKWREYWNFDRVPHPNNNLSEIEKENDRDEKVFWLGNMTLLRSRLNASLRNYDFERKINGDGRKRGIRHYADLLITKDIVERFDQGDKTWNEEKIENRTKEFTDMFLKIWGVV
ncbi:MAG: DNAse/DNA nickase specific for phosphorothioated or glycosylated phage DNA [Candidatus Alkanophagales archaeon MCA70_species_1]|nr:DNAse/DNA nickase specific for phosphorothioated or glycosylated phage DNA [Candidatus Alkanophaga volatiphilum]